MHGLSPTASPPWPNLSYERRVPGWVSRRVTHGVTAVAELKLWYHVARLHSLPRPSPTASPPWPN